jgi:hypothetical protein
MIRGFKLPALEACVAKRYKKKKSTKTYKLLLEAAEAREEQDKREREEFRRNLFNVAAPNEENH